MKQNTLKMQLVDQEGKSLGEMSFPTDLNWLELLGRLTLLEAPAPEESNRSNAEPGRGKGNSGKYGSLARHLAEQADETVTLTFRAIEKILGFDLPPTARGPHARAWWANTPTHVQGRAWMTQGWKTANVDPDNETLEFRRA